MRLHTQATLFIFFSCIWSSFANPEPAGDNGAKPEDRPLPGRTDVSITKEGLVRGYYGDDWIPQHGEHVKETIARFPGNGDALPYRPDGPKNRAARLKSIPPGGKHSVTREPLMRDEKTLAIQHNENQDTDSTFRHLPHYESGGKYATYENERRDRWLAEHPGKSKKDYTSSNGHMRDGSYTTENAMTSKMQNVAVEWEKQNPGKKAQLQLVNNPGWLPLSAKQQRGHEAPAKMTGASYDDLNAKYKAQAYKPPIIIDPVKFKEPRPAKPVWNKPVPESLLPPVPTIPQYRPATYDAKKDKHETTTPGMHPPTEKESLNRVPVDRPQNRKAWEAQKPSSDAVVNQKPQPAIKPVGDHTGKEGLSHEAPVGSTAAHAAPDTSNWKPYGTDKGKAPAGKSAITETQAPPEKDKDKIMAYRPKQKDPKSSDPASPVSSRLRQRPASSAPQQDALTAARVAFDRNNQQKKKGSKSKRDLLVSLARRRLQRRAMLLSELYF